MWIRLGGSAVIAIALVAAAVWLGKGFLPEEPLPLEEWVSLELVEPLESERIAAGELRDFLAVAPSKRFREAAARRDLRRLAVAGEAPGAPPGGSIDTTRKRDIPGTIVPPTSRERAELMERARSYARAYNLLVERSELEAESTPSNASAADWPERTAPSGVGATR